MDDTTTALPSEVVREAARRALEHGMSFEEFIDALRHQVAMAWRYEEARERATHSMRKGMDLGTGGKIPWTRDELHER